MRPEQAQQHLHAHEADRTSCLPPYAIDALQTVAGMREEEDWRLVNPETNGGKYELTRHSRLVGGWQRHA